MTNLDTRLLADSLSERYVTISVDDGHCTDLKTAELLRKYSLQATFYVPARNPERPVMSEEMVRQIAREFEVGGHTFNHRPLTCLPREQIWSEIVDGKTWLEDLTGQQVVSFCYPRGKYDHAIAAIVEKAGFLGGRTCRFNLTDFPANPYLWGVSTHACCHSSAVQLRHAFLESNFSGAWNFLSLFRHATDWQQHFMYALDHVNINGGIAHLYLHSWEIEDHAEWGKLEDVFSTIADRKRFTPITNGGLFELFVHQNKSSRKSSIGIR